MVHNITNCNNLYVYAISIIMKITYFMFNKRVVYRRIIFIYAFNHIGKTIEIVRLKNVKHYVMYFLDKRNDIFVSETNI